MRLLFLAAVALVACGRIPTGPIFPGEPAPDVHPREFERWLDDKDRAEMILPPRPDWSPSKKGWAAKLNLIAGKTTIRVGEALPYRLEFVNMGGKPIRISGMNSVFKGGPALDDHEFQIWIDAPDGSRNEIATRFIGDGCAEDSYPLLRNGTEEEKARISRDYMTRRERLSLSENRLNIEIAPGETLVSRPWVDDANLDSCADEWRAKQLNRPAQDGFRHLRADNFPSPGSYRIHFTYVDALKRMGDEKLAPGYPRWERMRASILTSNVIEIVVKP